MSDTSSEVTRILQEFDERENAADDLLPLVYEQLHAIAGQRMRNERSGHTLQATALVHEAYVRLIGDHNVAFHSRGHFYAAAAESMRRILIDHARKKKSLKRGGGKPALPLSVVDLASEQDPSQILALDEALKSLEAEDPRAAQVVQFRFFAGLGVEETAEILGVSERTVMREWAFARAKLFKAMSDAGDEDEPQSE